MLVFTLELTLAVMAVPCCGWHVFVTVAREMVLCAAAQRKTSNPNGRTSVPPKRWNGRSDRGSAPKN